MPAPTGRLDPWSRSRSTEARPAQEKLPALGLFCPRCAARERCAFHSLAEEQLEDVDQEEGRRRGGALLDLLGAGATSPPATCPKPRRKEDPDDASTHSGGSEAWSEAQSEAEARAQWQRAQLQLRLLQWHSLRWSYAHAQSYMQCYLPTEAAALAHAAARPIGSSEGLRSRTTRV